MIRQHRRDIGWGLLIFALALALRAAFIFWVNPDPSVGAANDTWFYHHSARALADGRGYIFPGQGGAPTAYWPPGYTGLLASAYLLPGPDLITGKLLNAFLGAVSATLLFVIGRQVWNRRVGVAAAALLTFLPSHVFYSTLTLTEVVYAALLIGALLLFARALGRRDSAGIGSPVALGLLLGVAAMFRGEGVLLPLVFGAVWWQATGALRRGVQFAAPVLLGVAVVIGGWTVRNAVQMDAPVPINTGSSVVLALSHWDGADGGGSRIRSRQVLLCYEDLPYPEREVKGARKRTRDALEYMVTHPGHELSLIPRRLFELYRHDHGAVNWIDHYDVSVGDATLDRLRALSDAYYYALLVLAAAGIPFWWRLRKDLALLFLGIIAYISALIGLFFVGDQRYHASLTPIFCLAAAPALLAVWDSLAARLTARTRASPGDRPGR